MRGTSREFVYFLKMAPDYRHGPTHRADCRGSWFVAGVEPPNLELSDHMDRRPVPPSNDTKSFPIARVLPAAKRVHIVISKAPKTFDGLMPCRMIDIQGIGIHAVCTVLQSMISIARDCHASTAVSTCIFSASFGNSVRMTLAANPDRKRLLSSARAWPTPISW